MSDVLLICSEPESLDHLSALASATQATAEVSTARGTPVSMWRRAAVVVIGVEELAAVLRAGWPRRENVVIYGYADPSHWQAALALGAEAVIEPPGEPGWLADRLTQVRPDQTDGVVVGLIGCRGGAGASVFACAMALAAVRAGHRPYLLDLDPWGCGLPVILGVDSMSGLTWDQVSAGTGRIPATSLQNTISEVEGIALVGWGEPDETVPAAGVVGAVVDAARSCTPITLVDLSRSVSPARREALARCDRVLMVVPADVRSVRAAARLAKGLPQCEVIVRGPNPGGLVVADISQALGLPVLAAVAAERGLDARLERGEPPGWRARSPLGRAGSGLLREVLG